MLALEVVQFVLVLAVGVALGWNLRTGVFPALGLLLLGTIAFAGIGMLMAGTLRAEANLAASNALFLVLLFLGGMAYPLDKLPGALEAVAKLLPAAALSETVRAVLTHAAVPDRRARRARRLGHRGTVARGPLLPLGRVSRRQRVERASSACSGSSSAALRRDPEHAVAHHAVGIDEPRLRDAADAVAVTDLAVGVEERGVGDTETVGELHRVRAQVPERDREHVERRSDRRCAPLPAAASPPRTDGTTTRRR